MRRSSIFVGVVLVLAGTLPAHAGTTGSIALPIGSPTLPRLLHNAGFPVGSVAKVFALGPGADGKTYTLTRTGGFGNLDAYFYTDNGGQVGDICNPIPSEAFDDLINQTTETGVICPAANQTVGWGIVILRWGGSAGFTLDW